MRRKPLWRIVTFVISGTVLCLLGVGLVAEARSWWLQSELLSSYARDMTFQMAAGSAPAPRYPVTGPHNLRLGYVQLPQMLARLEERGFAVESQARISPTLRQFVDLGGFPVFREKTQAGLTLLDHHGTVAFSARFPARTYPSFEAIPPIVVATLLFIENRELLDAGAPRRNPAVEWDRLALLLPGLATRLFDSDIKLAGGSTLATQIEKFRHSPDGQTQGPVDKLRQMISASVRAYADGPDTSRQRRQIVADYLNATPLSAQPGFGEINGLGDGLFAWFGTEFDEANHHLFESADASTDRASRARIYKQVLALLLAQRRPSYYLMGGRAELLALTDRHLRRLRDEGIIEPALAEAALQVDAGFRAEPTPPTKAVQLERNASQSLRSQLLGMLGLPGIYQLDRLDLTAETTLDLAVQSSVTDLLHRLNDPEVADRLGLFGQRLLDPKHGNGDLIYSLTVYERGPDAHYLRVQTDNLDQPFDVGQGAKLDLGSTAKLRTLITYLEIIERLRATLHGRPAAELRERARLADPLTAWVAGQLLAQPEIGLLALLEGAMARRYSASPWEAFFTGGGVHRFANFNADDNGRMVTVAQALRDSINLPFIRIMRDIVRFHLAEAGMGLLEDGDHPDRQGYLTRFADREGQAYLRRFLDELQSLDGDQVLARLASQARPRAERLAVIFRSLRPTADAAALAAFLAQQLPNEPIDDGKLARLYQDYAIERFSLNDRAYLAGLHPLKLWLGAYLQQHPQAPRAEVVAASATIRLDSYRWLFKTRNKATQDRRIRMLLEEEAFRRIHESWRRLGYPFESLVPSYATAIGSSADRPDSLAELVGILLNDGVWQPSLRLQRLHFAGGTPYETVMERQPSPPRRLLAPEIAQLVRAAMVDVVETGTARRLSGAFRDPDGQPVPIGAKTGTGDHRRKFFNRAGRLTGSEAVRRTATVVFFIGDRLFGNLSIYVSGPKADDFTFTSSLPAQLLKSIAPALQPLLDGREPRTVEAKSVKGA